MKHKLILVAACLAALTTLVSADIYIRNRPVPSNPNALTIYLSEEMLAKYFTPDELERCEFNLSTGEVKVDGTVLSERLGPNPEANVPVLALAEALGFKKRTNHSLGVVDYVAPEQGDRGAARADIPKRKGPEYNAAAARMKNSFRESPQLTSHPELERVQRIGQELAAVSDMPGMEWNFLIVSDPSPNAYCSGVGWVAITSGLLAMKLSDDELAGILAHEVGHGCRRDIEEQNYNVDTANNLASQVQGLKAELNALEARQAELYDRARRAEELAREMTHPSNIMEMRQKASEANRQAEALARPIRNLQREINLKVESWSDHKDFATASEFKHQDEIDADKKGLRYATSAGYAADGLMSALQKLAERNARTFGQVAFQGGYSHPPLAKRIDTMRKVLSDWRKP